MKSVWLFLLLLTPFGLSANNISVSGVSLTGINTTNQTIQVQCTVSWENSWRTNVGPANWDAAWLFVKYRRAGVGNWLHARLSNTGHVAPSGSVINTGLLTPSAAYNATTNAGMGAFLYRSSITSGTFTVSNLQLQWNYGANGLTNTDLVEVKVFAIEMVYVPTGAFVVGDSMPANKFPITTINTANATTDPSGVGSLGGAAGGYPTGDISPTEFKPNNATYPNGFNAFYCMKYEITQKAYVDFLNTLTLDQQQARVKGNIKQSTITKRYVVADSNIVVHRNGILAPANGATGNNNGPLEFGCDLNGNKIMNEASDGLGIACNFLNRNDIMAYLWWAGLRPMTEMEYEKACRGNLPLVHQEYAWGDATVTKHFIASSTLSNSGTASEVSNTVNANAIMAGLISTSIDNGPCRVGMFATAGSTRKQAGATYYGIMEMSGNVQEQLVGGFTTLFKTFVGSHGSGLLQASGVHAGADWSLDGGRDEQVYFRNSNTSETRTYLKGGRGVRSAQ